MKVVLRFALVVILFVLSLFFTVTAKAQVIPQGQLPLTGSTGAHDPTLFKEGNFYYVVRTNSNQIWRAPSLNGPWATIGNFPSFYGTSRWAPHAHKVGDTWYIYYATSAFGTNNSYISVMSSTTPDNPASWVLRNQRLITSGTESPTGAGYNAIDPAIHQDGNGDWWIVFGSHFDGIMIQRLNSDLISVTGPITLLAHRGSEQFPVQPAPSGSFNRLEGPVIFKRANYYYLITAWDWCCRGNPADNTYKVVIGRSENITGPYVDKNGVPLAQGGGSIILNSRTALPGVTPTGLYRAPGGVDIFIENDIYYVIYHAYRTATTMAIRTMDWHDGWPFFYEANSGPYDLRDGAYYRFVNQDGIITNPNSLQNPVASNRCLTASQNESGLNVIQALCDNTSLGQVWQLIRKFDGFYQVRSLSGDQNTCLEIADGSGTVGTDVVLTACRDEDNNLQQWYFDDTGHGFHRPVVKQANLALEIENVNGVIGTNVVGGYRRDGVNEAGNLTQAAKWPPQQWRFSMVVDTTPPTIMAQVAGTLGQNDWYVSDVAVTWNVQDNESPINGSSGCESVTVDVDTAGTTLICEASSFGGSSSQSVTIKRDTTGPVVTVTGVSDGATYAVGSVPTASCDTQDATSEVAIVATINVSGGNPNGTGVFTVTCADAVDNAGNAAPPVSASYTVKETLAVVVLGQEGVRLAQKATVNSGAVVANSPSAGPFLEGGVEMSLGQQNSFLGDSSLYGDSVKVGQKSAIPTVHYNHLQEGQQVNIGQRVTPLSLPVVELPPFLASSPSSNNITVAQNGSLTLDAGSYGDFKVNQKATIIFSGGEYHFASWDVGQQSNIYFAAPSVVRIANRLSVGQKSFIGPQPSAVGVSAREITLYVAGLNGGNGSLSGSPKTAVFDQESNLQANVYAPNGTLLVYQKANVRGALLARWVDLGQDVVLTLESAFTTFVPLDISAMISTVPQPQDEQIDDETATDDEVEFDNQIFLPLTTR